MNSIQEQYKELYENFESVVDHLKTVYEGDDPDNYLDQLECQLDKARPVSSVQEMRQQKVQNKAIPLNIDEWKYFHDPTGQGIVVNAWIDDSDDELMIEVFVVPQEKAINNDWHNDMQAIEECD